MIIKYNWRKNMTQRYQVYKCKICGGIVEVLVHGGNDLICCGEKMEVLAREHCNLHGLWKSK